MLRPKHIKIRRKQYNKSIMNPDNQQYTPPQSPVPNSSNTSEEALQKVYNPLSVMRPGERVICHITRHPFGLIGMYLMSALLLIGAFVGAGLAAHYATNLTSRDKMYIFVGAVIFAALILAYMYMASYIYNGNRWIVTSDSITQITQVGLFRKQTSQLSLGNLEDVTFEQESILQSMFGFGTLHVETAGEHSKFVFLFCPNPQKCAVEIIQAHEQYMEANPEGGSRDNQGLTQPQRFNPGVDVNTEQ